MDSTRINAARQVRPAAVAAPTASGVISPTPAAAALASVSTAGPNRPWCCCSTVVDTFRASPPANPITSIVGSVIASSTPATSDPAQNTAIPTATATTARRANPNRAHRRTRPTPRKPDSTTPAASISECRPATELDTASSSRNSGMDGPMPYRNQV
jgi:hypothetical protein